MAELPYSLPCRLARGRVAVQIAGLISIWQSCGTGSRADWHMAELRHRLQG
jgi:hypothetical protein